MICVLYLYLSSIYPHRAAYKYIFICVCLQQYVSPAFHNPFMNYDARQRKSSLNTLLIGLYYIYIYIRTRVWCCVSEPNNVNYIFINSNKPNCIHIVWLIVLIISLWPMVSLCQILVFFMCPRQILILYLHHKFAVVGRKCLPNVCPLSTVN